MLRPLLMILPSSIMHTGVRGCETIDRVVAFHGYSEEAVGLALFVAGGEFGGFVLAALLTPLFEEGAEEGGHDG